MDKIIAVDWGTSNFRLFLVDEHGTILRRVFSAHGVSTMDVSAMLVFLNTQINLLPFEYQFLPVVMCGAVGSSTGLLEIPYVECPVNLFNTDMNLVRINSTLPNLFIVPGLKFAPSEGQPDVMRGEETQVLGWLLGASVNEYSSSLLCLPGTHSKWVHVKAGVIESFNTVFSGELYEHLCNRSLLVVGDQTHDLVAFNEGLKASAGAKSLAQQLFTTRSRMLTGVHKASVCASYLSGVLIGDEVKGALAENASDEKIHLIGSRWLNELYKIALAFYGKESICHCGDVAVVKGLHEAFKNFSIRQPLSAVA